MAEKHPYISGTTNLIKAVQQLRSALPGKIDADVFKKLGIAPKNESYLINILRFLGVIDQDGAPTTEARNAFTQHDDAAFGQRFAGIVKKAYSGLFSLHGDRSWTLDTNSLVTFFRQSDQTTALVGGRQAATFRVLASLAGHGDLPAVRPQAGAKGPARDGGSRARTRAAAAPAPRSVPQSTPPSGVALAVRIEINLPISDDQATYDRIFRSIRENLLNG